MRCFPYADGNEISRGIQGGEMLAKRLAAGLDTDTEEYKRSVQALYPEKAKRGMDTYMQRQAVHELPRNPMQALAGGSSPMHTPASMQQQAEDPSVPPPNLLGIHMGTNVSQQPEWRHCIERTVSLPDYFAGHGQYQQQSMQNQSHTQRSVPMPAQQQQQAKQQQQSFFGGEANPASSPYKTYSPQMTWTPKSGSLANTVDYESASSLQNSSDYPSQTGARCRTDAPGRMSLFRSMTHTGAQEQLLQKAGTHRDQSSQSVINSACRSLSTGWSNAPLPPLSKPELPRDIWAPAPKRPTLVPVDPEDVSKEKRAKPQPIGTRAGGSSGGGKSVQNGGKQTSEPVGQTDKTDIKKSKNDGWISDSMGSPESVSAGGTGGAGQSLG